MASKLTSIPTFKNQINQSIVDILEDALLLAKEGQLTSLIIHMSHINGDNLLARSQCDNRYEIAGKLLDAAMNTIHEDSL